MGDFAENLKPHPTSPKMRAGRRNPLSMDGIKSRRRKLGGLRRVARVSRPDICSRWARIATRINALSGSDVFRINELARVAEKWQQATALRYSSATRPWETLGWDGEIRTGLRSRCEKVHYGSVSLAGWSDAAYGGQSTGGGPN